MKNHQNQEKSQFPQPKKLFSIQINLHYFVASLLIFSFGIAIGIVFSSSAENLLSLALKLHGNLSSSIQNPVPTTAYDTITNNGHHTIPLEKIPKVEARIKKPKREDFIHEMGDEELMMKAATISSTIWDDQVEMVRKVAFMFLVKGPMHLAPLWERFFNGSQGLYSIYVHTSPSYNATFPKDSVFHGRRVPSKVQWGNFNMVEAERRLLANALLDPSNQRFVLLSESCIPLFNFSTVYSYLVNSKETFIEAFDQPGSVGRARYNHRMQPVVRLSQWRKGSQWFQIDRALALEVILDTKYFSVFKKYCKGNCYGDEHYLPTLVSIEFWKRNSNRTLTFVDWSKGGPHPGRFERPLVTVEFLERLRNNRTCKYNGEEGKACFMFARKFAPSSVVRLMLFAAKVLNIQ